ncbi:MAG: hypothetical protein RIS94_3365 [Pseudomonadota bacterium]|jgi:murein L,D-transpeptidase YcbB/YkuD
MMARRMERGFGASMRRACLGMMLAPVLALALAPAAVANAQAFVSPAELADALDDGGGDLAQARDFYAARGFRPLWIANGAVSPAAGELLALIQSAKLDGIKPKKAREGDLRKALDRAQDGGDPQDLLRVEVAASRALVAYVRLMRQAPHAGMLYADAAAQPQVPDVGTVLELAAGAPSIDAFVRQMRWMHPFYAPVRRALANVQDDATADVLRTNLERLRALPGPEQKRYVLVDAAGARLWMMEGGQSAGTMKVVVGKPDMPTPMMAGMLRTAMLNPYWNIPPDLVRMRIAPNVIDKGLGYLRAKGYEVLSDWSDAAAPADPALVDWQAVAAGLRDVRVRQRPGGDNFMGRVKFQFPNDQGIYLHDTPEKGLMKEDERQRSSGCVRLEDAPRLGRWLLGRPLPRAGKAPEQRIELPRPVPVYITYLTAVPQGDGTVAFRSDPYNRDGLGSGSVLAQAR